LERRLLEPNGWILWRHRVRFRVPRPRLPGGHWQDKQFYYNTAVSRVNVTNIHNTYPQTVVNNTTVTRVSYNGGTGGVTARPTAADQAAARAALIGNDATDAASPGGDG
jgi:hypothetical protein